MAATAVTREYAFYRHLCEELIKWAIDNSFAVHMSVRRRQKAHTFWNRLDQISDVSLDDDNLALFELKKLTREVICFYKGPLRYATAPEYGGANSRFHLKTWRWEKLLERAQNWVQQARKRDWSQDLQMQPQWAQFEDWWSPDHISYGSRYLITAAHF